MNPKYIYFELSLNYRIQEICVILETTAFFLRDITGDIFSSVKIKLHMQHYSNIFYTDYIYKRRLMRSSHFSKG